jgi:REP element-mobilizing transposase RayT
MQQRTRKKRQIIAHHLILTLYGHWPANDLRGSGSEDFYDPKFEKLGPIHHGRKPEHEQPSREELREHLNAAQDLMNFPVFWIDDAKRQAIAEAFREVIEREGYTCYACAIFRNHAHLVIRIHRDRHDAMLKKLMDASAARLRLRFPNELSAHHPIWNARPYARFCYEPHDTRWRINYVEDNPEKEGLPRQYWDFVQQYDDWPHHKRK